MTSWNSVFIWNHNTEDSPNVNVCIFIHIPSHIYDQSILVSHSCIRIRIRVYVSVSALLVKTSYFLKCHDLQKYIWYKSAVKDDYFLYLPNRLKIV
jgi:hypothetical protein